MKHKKISLTTQIVIMVCSVLFVANIILGVVLVRQSQNAMKTLIHSKMLDIVNTAAASLDGDFLESYTDDEKGSAAYDEVIKRLDIYQKNVDIKFIYTVKRVDDKHFVFVIDADPVDPGQFGEEVVFTEALLAASYGTPSVDNDAFEDRWGKFYSAYSPVYNSSGSPVAVVGIDFDSEWYDRQIMIHTISVLVVCIVTILVGAAIIILVTGRLRRNLAYLNRELSLLSVEVQKLTDELVADKNGESKVESAAESAPDPLTDLGDKIKAMQSELNKYVAYAQAQAYTDSMTGVGNKTAYLELVKTLNRELSETDPEFCVCVFDVNGLKDVNDNYGHEYGDMLITDVAGIISRVFGAENIFRTGGDEFIAILRDVTEESVKSKFDELDSVTNDFNANVRTYPMTLSFSKGYSMRTSEDKEYKNVFKRADNAMYRDKGEYYKIFGDRRKQ